MKTELKPCQFCGSSSYTTYEHTGEHGLKVSYAVCRNKYECGAKISKYGDENNVAEVWNRRTS